MVAINNSFSKKAQLSVKADKMPVAAKAGVSKRYDFLPLNTKVEIATKGFTGKIERDLNADSKPLSLNLSASAASIKDTKQGVLTVAKTSKTPAKQVKTTFTSKVRTSDLSGLRESISKTQSSNNAAAAEYNAQLAAMRYGFLPSAAELNRIRPNPRNWLSGQLTQTGLDFGSGVGTYDERIRYFINLRWQSGGLTGERIQLLTDLYNADARQYHRQMATTQRPFLHRYAQFLMNHFSISFGMNDPEQIMLGLQAHSYFAHVIVPNMFLKFEDMLNATARFPGMLQTLSGESSTRGANPLENYAREVMELHTLGADSGYTQTDVRVLARLMTGMRFLRRPESTPDAQGRIGGRYYFDAGAHDAGAKSFPFLGIEMAAYPAAQGDSKITEILTALARHPATARRFAKKLVFHFLSNDIDAPLAQYSITRIANVFTSTGGDLMAVARALVLDMNGLHPIPHKSPTPINFLMGMIRAGGLITAQGSPSEDALLDNMLNSYLPMMNMPHWQAPDVRGFLVDNERLVNESTVTIMLDHASILAPQIAARMTGQAFYNNTVSALSRYFVISGTPRISTFAGAEPVNAIICAMMSPEFLRKF